MYLDSTVDDNFVLSPSHFLTGVQMSEQQTVNIGR